MSKKNYHIVCKKGLKDPLKSFLLKNSITFEISGYGQDYYIGMSLTDIEKQNVNKFLQSA